MVSAFGILVDTATTFNKDLAPNKFTESGCEIVFPYWMHLFVAGEMNSVSTRREMHVLNERRRVDVYLEYLKIYR